MRTGAKLIPCRLDLARRAADDGDEAEARRRWAQAIELGYVPAQTAINAFERRIDRHRASDIPFPPDYFERLGEA